MKQYNTIYTNELTQRKNIIRQNYGYTANLDSTLTKNFENAIKAISNNYNNSVQISEHNSYKKELNKLQPRNLSVHNLCIDNSIPPGTKDLLGLGLKFCLTTPKANPNIKECLRQMAYKIRTKQYLKHNDKNNITPYIPQIYIKVQGWNPPPASLTIENRLTDFEKLISKTVHSQRQRSGNSYNLTPNQRQTLNKLKANANYIIMPTDKNLGPAIMNRNEYIKQCLTEHLLTSHYRQLSNNMAMDRLNTTKTLLINNFHEYKHQLSQAEVIYFTRSLKQHHRIPIFYGMPKVHKTPMTLRPVVSCINSFLSIFSNWLDFKMKDLLFLIPSYIKDSKSLLSDLKGLRIPSNAKLFTADATAMYSNIDTDTGVNAFVNLFNVYKNQIPQNFPKDLFLQVLRTVMDNNIFKFGDTFWLQTQGTAMGTPTAPLYSILTFGFHENTTILNTFQANLLYYKRFIDDIFGVWIDNKTQGNTPINEETSWDKFKQQLNTFGSLRWNIETPSTATNFLDLTIEIKDKKLVTTTYQKALNLYLYIPPLSAHPSSCIKGLITGEIYRYWLQNTELDDFTNITANFIIRLTQRGHQLHQIIPMLQTAAANIDNINTRSTNRKINDENTLYIPWRHHPSNIKNQIIRQIYNQTLKGVDGFDDMRLAISRPKNLRDVLCKSDLPLIQNNNVSDILALLPEPNTI
jgi:hypothetical protein